MNSKLKAALIGAIAAFGINVGSANAVSGPVQDPNLVSLLSVTGQICKDPPLIGLSRSLDGGISGAINPSKLVGLMAKAKLEANAKGSVTQTSGLLQKDLIDALKSHDQCAAQLSLALLHYLEVRDAKTHLIVKAPPSHLAKEISSRSDTVKDNISSETINGSSNIQATVEGNNNTTNTQNNAPGPTSCNGANCSAIGVVAGPPVTEQERAVSALRLRSELEELALFPAKPPAPVQRPTLYEGHQNLAIAYALYTILSKYYTVTIRDMTYYPDQLFEFKKQYYEFEAREYALENSTIDQIGKMSSAPQLRIALSSYFEYYLDREMGFDQKAIQQSGFVLFTGDWGQADKISESLMKMPTHAQIMENIKTYDQLTNEAKAILAAYTLQ